MEKRSTVKPMMFWQISILMDSTSTVQVTVSENCLVSELLQKIKKHPHIPRGASYRLYTSDGESIEENEDNGKQHLSFYRITDKSTVNLSVGLSGGWPTREEIERQPRNPKPSQRVQITDSNDHPDILSLDFDNPRVIMPCGHAIAPLSLALHCLTELENKKPMICCPDGKCNVIWPFSLIRESGCLSDKETVAFEKQLLLNQNNKEVKQCPKCLVSCHRVRDTDIRVTCLNCKSKGEANCEFCWSCLHEWKGGDSNICSNESCDGNAALFRILAECKTILIKGVKEKCPSLRACPKCFMIIEHIRWCKHMICTRCKHDFCFACLKSHHWSIDSYSNCVVAPRQNSNKETVAFEEQLLLNQNNNVASKPWCVIS